MRAWRFRARLLWDALDIYGWHLEDCPAFDGDGPECTCNFRSVRRSLLPPSRHSPRSKKLLHVYGHVLARNRQLRAALQRSALEPAWLRAQQEILIRHLGGHGALDEALRAELRDARRSIELGDNPLVERTG